LLGDGLVTAGELDSGGESIADEDVDGIAAILEFALRVGEGVQEMDSLMVTLPASAEQSGH
jgi:hypothetical protein